LNKQDQNNFQSFPNKAVPAPSEVPIAFGRSEVLNIGIIGAGSFAGFAAKAFLSISGINIIAITDINEDASIQMANDLNAKSYNNYESFLNNPIIDLVYIATPPFLHYQQSKLALLAGKHVICEKPASLKTSEAEELHELASANNLLYVVNLMQRYNALYTIVDTIVKNKILGNFLHGFFENYASDENLGIDHWFWDETKSGGIFIEHGIHFFDMFSGWLGNGEVVNALQIQRPGVDKRIIDRVHATVMYKDGAVNFYHGFDQPKILDRQEMRLLFEHGEITLYGWIPVKMKLHGLTKDDELKSLKDLIGEANVIYHNKKRAGNRTVNGRFAEINFDDEITLECGHAADKQDRYRELLTSMLTNQWNWIKDHNHKRIIDGNNAVESLRMAEQATKIAQKY
jgi:predicted dehydrogenase